MVLAVLCFALTLLQHSNSLANGSHDPIEKAPVILGQGEQRLLTLPGLRKYSLGSNHVRVLPPSRAGAISDERLMIKGVTPGTGDLWVWKNDGCTEHRTIRVIKVSNESKNLELEKALSQLSDVEVILTGTGATLRGTVYQLTECAKIATILRNFSKEVQDETDVSESLLSSSKNKLSRWIEASGLSSKLHLEVLGKSLWVRGNLASPGDRASVEKQLRNLFPLIQTDIETFPDHSPTVYFRVFLLELKRSEFRTLGLSWPSSVGASLNVTSAGPQTSMQMDFALQQLEGNGYAKILSNPEMVVRAPGEAELFAGGEFPIKIQTKFHSNVIWKNFGLILRLNVSKTSGDRVRLDIFSEVSHLDATIAVDDVPGIQANRMKTQVDARFGTPLFLSGLLQQGMREAAKGLPFLRGIPVFGKLFGSEDYLNERSELVALLYPHAHLPQPPLQKIQRHIPLGPIPLPRNWTSPEEERRLREAKDFPWNALE